MFSVKLRNTTKPNLGFLLQVSEEEEAEGAEPGAPAPARAAPLPAFRPMSVAEVAAYAAGGAPPVQHGAQGAGQKPPPVAAFEPIPLAELTQERLEGVVKDVFGFEGFRGRQQEVVQNVLQGKSTLAILPTGD